MKERSPIVFIVDDDEAVRNSLRLLFKSVGLAAAALPTAQQFLQSTIRSRPAAWCSTCACPA